MSQPTIVTNLVPANNATVTAGVNTISWRCENATAYEVYFWVSSTTEPLTPTAVVYNTSYTTVSLGSGKIYYWYVIARNGGKWCKSDVFTINVA